VGGGTDIDPRFAERAADLLDRGDVPAALSVLLTGIKAYPAYVTAHLLLSQCYERLGKPQDAAQQVIMARRLVPGLGEVRNVRREGGAAESGVDFMLRQLPHVKLRPEVAPVGRAEGTAAPDGVQEHASEDAALPIVSATLAEIYADQGRYREAIEAYSRLAQQRPAEAGRYRERLAELEKLLQGVDKLGEA
jgi:tetratricopeptide (TPR) repeat protein